MLTCLYVKSASECDLIKPLYENGDALKKKERLSRIVCDCRETPPSSDKNECTASLAQWLLEQID